MKIFFLLAVLLICMKFEAQGQDCCDCDSCYLESRIDHNNFYGQFSVGPNFLQTKNNRGIKPEFKTGFIISGSYGYRWCHGLRLEAEYAYRWNKLESVRLFKKKFETSGNFHSSSYLANLLWDIPFTRCGCDFLNFQPYIGGGIGYDFQEIHVNSKKFGFDKHRKHFDDKRRRHCRCDKHKKHFDHDKSKRRCGCERRKHSEFDERKKHLAWQLMIGFGYTIACDIGISMEYKFHRGGFSHIKSHSLEAGINYTFGLRY